MSRKRLNFSEETKDFIVDCVVNKIHTVTALANMYGCHPRSINRVMEERGMAAVTSRAKGTSEASRIKALLATSGVSISQLEHLVHWFKQSTASTDALSRDAALFRPGAQVTGVATHAQR